MLQAVERIGRALRRPRYPSQRSISVISATMPPTARIICHLARLSAALVLATSALVAKRAHTAWDCGDVGCVRARRRIGLCPHRAGASAAATTAAASAGTGYCARLAVCARGEGGEYGELAPRFAAAIRAGGGRVHLAHRAALLKAVGAGNAGVFVYRHCNNLACCPSAYRAYRVSGGTAARRRCRDALPPALCPF